MQTMEDTVKLLTEKERREKEAREQARLVAEKSYFGIAPFFFALYHSIFFFFLFPSFPTFRSSTLPIPFPSPHFCRLLSPPFPFLSPFPFLLPLFPFPYSFPYL